MERVRRLHFVGFDLERYLSERLPSFSNASTTPCYATLSLKYKRVEKLVRHWKVSLNLKLQVLKENKSSENCLSLTRNLIVS